MDLNLSNPSRLTPTEAAIILGGTPNGLRTISNGEEPFGFSRGQERQRSLYRLRRWKQRKQREHESRIRI